MKKTLFVICFFVFVLWCFGSISVQAQQPDSTVVRACEECAARLTLSEAKVVSLQQEIAFYQAQLQAKDTIIKQQDGIIQHYEAIDKNSQKIDTNSGLAMKTCMDRLVTLDDDNKSLARELDRYKGERKWVFGGGIVTGIAADRLLKKN